MTAMKTIRVPPDKRNVKYIVEKLRVCSFGVTWIKMGTGDLNVGGNSAMD